MNSQISIKWRLLFLAVLALQACGEQQNNTSTSADASAAQFTLLSPIETGIDFENKVIDYPQLVAIVGQKLEQEGLINSLALRPLLYQLDISEDYVQQEITGKPKESTLLSDAIIKRCFAKVIYRKKFR